MILPDICAVIVAAGCGIRMQFKYPKQYLSIDNKTILEYSVETLLKNPRITRMVIAINPHDTYFTTLPLAKNTKIIIVNGGKKRVDSVLAGIKASGNAQWILVHDAARPCLHPDDLKRLLAISENSKVGGILATLVHDTIKRAFPNENTISHTVDRRDLWRALTPQFFPRQLLYDCLLRAIKDGITITDEASALEYCGFHPELIEGRADNIKVTRKEELKLAQLYFSHSIKQ